MYGELSIYCPIKRLSCFRSGDLSSRRAIVVIAGLTDGYLALPYLELLSRSCLERGFCLYQVLLSSSYSGFGTCSLDTDADELAVFLDRLARDGMSDVHLLGHSTGCQDIVWLLRKKGQLAGFPRPASVILQGPVSDADYLHWSEDGRSLRERIAAARAMPADAIMPTRLLGCPTTAYRFLSLAVFGGDDDMFSARSAGKGAIVRDELAATPCLVVMSGRDQYIPAHLSPQQLLGEFGAEHQLFLDDADHSISGRACQDKFIDGVFEFIQRVSSGR